MTYRSYLLLYRQACRADMRSARLWLENRKWVLGPVGRTGPEGEEPFRPKGEV